MEAAVYDGAVRCGTLWLQEHGLYSVFHSVVNTDSVCRLVAEFEGGELVLGVPAPEHGTMQLSVSIPTSRRPKGKLLRGCLRTGASGWNSFPGGSIHGLQFPPREKKGEVYRFRWKPGERLPCDELLCFYRYVREGERTYLELKLDSEGMPQE